MGRTSHIWNGKIWKNKGHVPNHQNGYVSEYHHVQSPKCSQQCHLAQWGGLFHLSHHGDSSSWRVTERHRKTSMTYKWHGYGSIPIHTIFRGMNIHLPAILMFTRGTRFWHTATCLCQEDCGRFEVFRCRFKNPRADNNFIAAGLKPVPVRYLGLDSLDRSFRIFPSYRCNCSSRACAFPIGRMGHWGIKATRNLESKA